MSAYDTSDAPGHGQPGARPPCPAENPLPPEPPSIEVAISVRDPQTGEWAGVRELEAAIEAVTVVMGPNAAGQPRAVEGGPLPDEWLVEVTDQEGEVLESQGFLSLANGHYTIEA